jgi:hypothetical protein
MKGKQMKTLIGAMLFAVATLGQAQALEADLDGNASALVASEMRPAPQSKSSQAKRQNKASRERVASR